MKSIAAGLVVVGLMLVQTVGAQETTPAATEAAADSPASLLLREALSSGDLEAGIATLAGQLQGSPNDDSLRFALGFLQFVDSVEGLGQSLYRYGLEPESELGLPFLRMPVPANPAPEAIDHAAFRNIAREMLQDLEQCESTLAEVDDTAVSLTVAPLLIQLDLNGDAEATANETLWAIYSELNRIDMFRAEEQPANEPVPAIEIRFDAGDVYWLRGYTHLLSAFLEVYLAHDDSQLFDHTSHLFFAAPDTSFQFLREDHPGRDAFDWREVTDYIAFVHLIRLPVTEPARMTSALEHLKQVTALSRQSWEAYRAETDNDREWIPNPRQTGVLGAGAVEPEMVEEWMRFLDEIDAVLEGKKLIPFWRGSEPLGVNLAKVFTDPQPLDLVLWVQGTAAAPYLEQGPMTTPAFWRELWQSFNGQFLAYAIWFN